MYSHLDHSLAHWDLRIGAESGWQQRDLHLGRPCSAGRPGSERRRHFDHIVVDHRMIVVCFARGSHRSSRRGLVGWRHHRRHIDHLVGRAGSHLVVGGHMSPGDGVVRSLAGRSHHPVVDHIRLAGRTVDFGGRRWGRCSRLRIEVAVGIAHLVDRSLPGCKTWLYRVLRCLCNTCRLSRVVFCWIEDDGEIRGINEDDKSKSYIRTRWTCGRSIWLFFSADCSA